MKVVYLQASGKGNNPRERGKERERGVDLFKRERDMRLKNEETHHSRVLGRAAANSDIKKVLNRSQAPELSMNTEGLRRGEKTREEVMGAEKS